MRFELFCECVNGKRRGLQFDRESVPCCWPGHRKVMLADVGPCTWHNECPAVRRPQLPPADDGRDGSADVSEVGWCQTTLALVNHHSQLETETLPDWKRVKITQNWIDVVELPGSSNDAHCCILNSLQLCQQTVADSIQQTVAVECKRIL